MHASKSLSRPTVNSHFQPKNKTLSNISIIDRISERQNRMEEKYFNNKIKNNRPSL